MIGSNLQSLDVLSEKKDHAIGSNLHGAGPSAWSVVVMNDYPKKPLRGLKGLKMAPATGLEPVT